MSGTPPKKVRVHRRRPPVPQQLPTAVLHPSPLNPRRSMDDDALRELGESIRAHGLLQPLVVRERSEGGYEVICGHRRRAAAKLVGVAHLDCMVRELTDAQAVEAMLAENSKRRDVPPLEESDALLRLVEWGQTPAALAERLGRTSKWVRDRLALARLVPELREMLAERRFGLGAAVRLTRLVDEDQVQLAERLGRTNWRLTAETAAREVQSAGKRLDRAPWPLDAPYGGQRACAGCVYRTDDQGDLFDTSRGAHCLSSPCWRAKLDVWVGEQRAAGTQVVENDYGDGPRPNDTPHWFKAVGLGEVSVDVAAPGVPRIVYVRGCEVSVQVDRGALVERLANHPDAEIAQAVTEYWGLNRGSGDGSTTERPSKPRPSPKHLRASMAALIEEVEARAEAAGLGDMHLGALRLVVASLIHTSWDSSISAIAKRRGLEKAALKKPTELLASMPAAALIGLLVEVSTERQMDYIRQGVVLDHNLWLGLLDLLGVDRPPHT